MNPIDLLDAQFRIQATMRQTGPDRPNVAFDTAPDTPSGMATGMAAGAAPGQSLPGARRTGRALARGLTSAANLLNRLARHLEPSPTFGSARSH